MFQRLVDHGCVNLASHMDPKQYSTGLIAGGGFGDIWKGRLHDGTEVAIKVLRFSLVTHNGAKAMKVCSTKCFLTWHTVKDFFDWLARYARGLSLVKNQTRKHTGVNGGDHVPRTTRNGIALDGSWKPARISL